MNVSVLTSLRQYQRPGDIGFDGLELVVFAPVNIRPPSLASAVDDMRWLDSVQNFVDICLVLHADASCVDILALLGE